MIEEKASTYYPYVEAVYSCPLFGNRFGMVIQTVYYEDEANISAQHHALLDVTKQIPKAKRNKPITLDITSEPRTSEGSMYDNPYIAEEDPSRYGLKPRFKPLMYSKKVVWARLAIPLVGPMLESRAIISSADLYHRLHRRSYCWYHGDDGWGKMGESDLRVLEKKILAKNKQRSKL